MEPLFNVISRGLLIHDILPVRFLPMAKKLPDFEIYFLVDGQINILDIAEYLADLT